MKGIANLCSTIRTDEIAWVDETEWDADTHEAQGRVEQAGPGPEWDTAAGALAIANAANSGAEPAGGIRAVAEAAPAPWLTAELETASNADAALWAA